MVYNVCPVLGVENVFYVFCMSEKKPLVGDDIVGRFIWEHLEECSQGNLTAIASMAAVRQTSSRSCCFYCFCYFYARDWRYLLRRAQEPLL